MKTNSIIKIASVSILFMLQFSACQELYDPKLEIDQSFLVVQGLVTDDGPGVVALSSASVFGQPRHRRPVYHAIIHIETDQGDLVRLDHLMDGYYYTPHDFRGEVDGTYILHIETANGLTYRSKPQTIQPPVEIDLIDAAVGTDYQYFPSEVSDRLFIREIEGTHVFIVPENTKDQNLQYRFHTNLYLQYTNSILQGMSPPILEYCWQNREVTNLVRRDVSHEETNRIRTAFVPRYGHQMHHFNFPRRDYASQRMVILRILSLNKDSYAYYEARYAQLSDAGKIFDPIAAQVPGNMYCVTDEDQLVFGLFETSAVTEKIFRLHTNFSTEEATIMAVDIDEPIPLQGCQLEEKPPFWI